MFKCPKCNNEMEQESQHQHCVMHVSDSYDYKTKEWIIPEYFLMEFERRFWCRACNLRNRYTYIDGNYKYILKGKE